MNKQTLFEHLKGLEAEIHQLACRKDCNRFDILLHDDFYEIGYSGKTYSKLEVLQKLPEKMQATSVWSQDFSLQSVTENVALLHYKSAHLDGTGDLHRHAQRSSLWLYENGCWQLRFHQGTPVSAFKQQK